MLHASFWWRLAMIVACVLLTIMSLPLTMPPKTAFAQQETISINPTQGPPDTKVTVTGAGWQPGWTVPIGTDISPTPLANAVADNNGAFSISITIPSSAPVGQLRIWAVIGNGGSADTWFMVMTNTAIVTVQKVWTADGNNNTKTTFAPGDAIHYMVEAQNASSTPVTATVTYLASGPQQIYYWSGSASLASGPLRFYSAPTIPTNASAGTYIIKVTVTYNSVSSQGSSQFTVLPSMNSCTTTGPTSATCNTPLYAGYIRTGSSAVPIQYELVTASWTQPSVDCSKTSDANTAVWVGMGGLNVPLVQIGTFATCNGGNPTYSAFWEMVFGTSNWWDLLRSRPHSIPKLVSSGDKMTATVQSAGSGNYELILNDTTAKWVFDSGLVSGPREDTTRKFADCIVERPVQALIHYQPLLADFGRVDFSSCTASGVSKGKHIVGGPVILTFLITQNGVVLAHPLPATITPATLKFSVMWDDSGTGQTI